MKTIVRVLGALALMATAAPAALADEPCDRYETPTTYVVPAGGYAQPSYDYGYGYRYEAPPPRARWIERREEMRRRRWEAYRRWRWHEREERRERFERY